MWVVRGLKARRSQRRWKKLEIFWGCRTHCALKEKKKASAKQEEQFIEFVGEIYRVQISHCAKYLIWLFCHALVFSIAIAGIKQEINENKDAKGTFIYELIQFPPKLRSFLYFKSAKSAWIFFSRTSTRSFRLPSFFFPSPICMSEHITAWSIQVSADLAGDNWKETGGIFFLHWMNVLLSLFGAREMEEWLGENHNSLSSHWAQKTMNVSEQKPMISFPVSCRLITPAGPTHKELQGTLMWGLGTEMSVGVFSLYLAEEGR